MVGKELAKSVDEGIKEAQDLVREMPEPLRTRTIVLKQNPNEVLKRLQEIDGVLIEFEER